MMKNSSSQRPRIIAFLGPVGVGKSTQRQLLAASLKQSGQKVNVTFLKTGHLFAYILEVILVSIFPGKKKCFHPIRILIEEKPHLFRTVFGILAVLDTISINIRFLFTVYIPVRLGRIVLIEEYVPATIADYIYLSEIAGIHHKTIRFALKSFFGLLFMDGPTQAIYLNADIETLRFRWRHRGSPNERSDYVHAQCTILPSLLRKLSTQGLLYLSCIDGSRGTPEEIHKSILDNVGRMVG
jgi:energy-coupling factor transporter ATP-binding protein EcfA2